MEHLKKGWGQRNKNLLRAALIGLLILLALLPALNILWIQASTGANNPSNDYQRTIRMTDQILSGQYDWGRYFQDTLQNNIHSYAFLMLVRLAIIRLSHWNIYYELYLGWLLAGVKLVFMYRLLTRQESRWYRISILPVLAALVFSTSQISMFTFGETALQQGLIQASILLGLWLLQRPGSLGRFIAVVLCGLAASWSGGGGLIALPVFLAGLLLWGYRKARYYLVWLAGAIAAGMPYLAYSALRRPAEIFGSDLRGRLAPFVTAIGFPFANDIGSGLSEHAGAFAAGLVGIALLSIGLLLLFFSRQGQAWRRSIPALLLIFWGALNIFQIVLTRGVIAPWYTTAFMPFWWGLVGLAYIAVSDPADSAPAGTPFSTFARRFQPVWAGLVLVSLLALYLRTNISYIDKSFYLLSRSPASAACLRHYSTAPTYCERLVFQWAPGYPSTFKDLGWPLEKHRLSMFAPRQRWMLQGDYVMESVQVVERPDVPGVAWALKWTDSPALWSDYRHLNLFLHTPNKVVWQIDLPAELESAVFTTAVAMDQAAPSRPASDGVDFLVYIQTQDRLDQLILSIPVEPGVQGWKEIRLPLTAYAGQSIALILTSDKRGNRRGDRLMLRSPRIDLVLDASAPPAIEPVQLPANTDLAPDFPIPTADDLLLGSPAPGDWRVTGARLSPNPNSWVVEQSPVFELNQPLDICIKDYSHFVVRLSAGGENAARAVRVWYKLDGHLDFLPEWSFWIPLLEDPAEHTYSYDLKLLAASLPARMTGLRLDFAAPSPSAGSNLAVSQVGFLKADETGFCSPDE